jgi:hypothetical protein
MACSRQPFPIYTCDLPKPEIETEEEATVTRKNPACGNGGK